MNVLEFTVAARELFERDPIGAEAAVLLGQKLFGIAQGREAVRYFMMIEGIRGLPETTEELWTELRKA
jgi:hypothetical protein